jgi:hypothetical protein
MMVTRMPMDMRKVKMPTILWTGFEPQQPFERPRFYAQRKMLL